MPDIEPAEKLLALDDAQLVDLHAKLHADTDSATVELHHLATTELGRRGIDHGHHGDEWASMEIEVDKAYDVDLVGMAGSLPLQDHDAFVKELGVTRGDVTVILTVDGYEMRVDPRADTSLEYVDVEKTIRERDGKFVIFDAEGRKELGAYDTLAQAKQRLRQIEYFAKADSSFAVPEGVQAAAARALEWVRDGKAGDGFTAVGRRRATQLATGQPVGMDTLVRMKSYFARHAVDKKALGFSNGEEGFPSAGRVAWDAWGGDAGRAWAESVVDEQITKAYSPEDDLTERQKSLYAAIEGVVAKFGEFDCNEGPDGAHYIPAEENVFADKGIRCANCVFYEGGGGCEIMNMPVEADAACKFWIIPEGLLGAESADSESDSIEPLMPLANLGDIQKHGNHDQSSHGQRGSSTLKLPKPTDTQQTEATKMAEEVIAGHNVEVDGMTAYFAMHNLAHADVTTDLANLDVADTNLFEKGNLGLERADMPQIPDEAKGQFLADMEARGIKVTRERQSPSSLKPIQREISGKKSGQIMEVMEQKGTKIPDTDKDRIFVTKDGFVLDGHHRWAAASMLDIATGGGFDVPVFHIDLDATEALSAIKNWNAEVGIKGLAMGEDAAKGVPSVKKMVQYADGVEKHGNHDQTTHAGGRSHIVHGFGDENSTAAPVSATPLSPKTRQQVDAILPRKVQREVYGTAFESAQELRRDNPTLANARASARLAARDKSVAALASATNDEDRGFHADRIMHAQGYIDGATGQRAMYSRPMAGLSDIFSIEKHGNHDQSSHGRRGASTSMSQRRSKKMESGKVPTGVRRDKNGRVICPEATGGYKAGIPEEVEFGGEKLTPEHSLWHHLESDGNGGYQITAERTKVHNKIIEDATAGIPKSDDPTFFMLGGGPAAGKSSALATGIEGIPTEASRKAVFVNADAVKEGLPEYERMRTSANDTDFFTAASFSHEESSLVSKAVQKAAERNGQDIVLDGTGDSSYKKLSGKVAGARASGYKVRAVYATVPTDVAVSRAEARSLGKERRYVPTSIVRGTHRDVSAVFPQAISGGLFDSAVLLDTNVPWGQRPHVIGEWGAGGRATRPIDRKAYDAFVLKSKD